MDARFTGLMKTRRRWTMPRKFGLFLFRMAREEDVKNVYY
jgi:hypothetical protein